MTERGGRNPEQLNTPPPMDGVHGRLVLADQKFLRAGEIVHPVDTTSTSFEDRNYHPFEKASEKNRKNYWETKGVASFDAQKQRWTNSLTASLSQPNNHDIFTKLSTVFQKAGVMDEQADHFSTSHATSIYQRYFEGTHPGGVKRFVQDVLETYTTNGRVDMQAINQNMTTLRWFANVFGEQGKAMVAELITAESKLKTTPDFVTKLATEPANAIRINTLNPEEKALLTFIADAGGIDQLQRNQPIPNPDRTQPTTQEEEEEETEAPPKHFKELKIWEKKDDIQEKLKKYSRVLLIGGTGCGKTKETPKFIRELLGPGELAVVTEPTQINVSSLGKQVSIEDEPEHWEKRDEAIKRKEEAIAQNASPEEIAKLQEEITKIEKDTLGKGKIGFQHGGETKTDPKNDTVFMTEGTLIQKILNDPNKRLQKNIRYIMIDEVHVQKEDTEKLIALLIEEQKQRETDIANGVRDVIPLTLLFTSATADKDKLLEKTETNPDAFVNVEGTTYPIKEVFEKTPPADKPTRAAEIIQQIITNKKSGDIAIGVATVNDIKKYTDAIKAAGLDVKVYGAHANTSQEEKDEINRKPAKGDKRRVIIGTDFIQTGVTMHRLKHIIISGEKNESKVEPKTGLTHTKREDLTEAEILQWKGRVGRLYPGTAYYLFTEDDYKKRQKDHPYPKPEMKRTDLTNLVLQMKRRGSKEVTEYDFLSSPLDPVRIKFAKDTLDILGATNADGSLSTIGERLIQLPVDFHLGRMIVEAERNDKGIKQACIIAAMKENSSALLTDRDTAMKRFKNPESDFLTNLNIWSSYEYEEDKLRTGYAGRNIDKDSMEKEIQNGLEKWCKTNGINYPTMIKVTKALENILKRFPTPINTQKASAEELAQYIAAGYADKVMQRIPGTNKYRWTRGHADHIDVLIHRRNSSLAGTTPDIIIAGSNSEVYPHDQYNPKDYVRVWDAQVVKPEWIPASLPTAA